MTFHRSALRGALAAAAVLWCMPVAMADQDLSGLPQAHQQGNITYITGGIGDEERDALKAVESDYNLHVMSAGVSGAFAGDTQISIQSRTGDQLVNVGDAGPIFYAKLPPGRYVVEATHGDQTRKQDITIASGSSQHVHFSWK